MIFNENCQIAFEFCLQQYDHFIVRTGLIAPVHVSVIDSIFFLLISMQTEKSNS